MSKESPEESKTYALSLELAIEILQILKHDALTDDLTLPQLRRLYQRLDFLMPNLSEGHQQFVVSQVREVALLLERRADPLRAD